MNEIAQDLTKQIDDGLYTPGSQLPSLEQLIEEYDVSVDTAQQAVGALIYEGIAERNPLAPSEVRVKTPYLWKKIGGNHSVTRAANELGCNPGVEILQFESVPSWPIVQKRLDLNPGDEVIIMERLRLADDKPVSLEFSYYPAKLYPGISVEMFTRKGDSQSSFKIMQEKFGLIPDKAIDEVSVAAVEKREADLLDLVPGTPVLIRFRLTISNEGIPVKGSRAIYLFRAEYELPI